MKKLLILVFSFVAITVSAQTKVISDPNATSRTITADFSAVSVETGVELYLTQGNETSLAVSASDQKYYAGFKTEVINGVLKLYYETNNYDRKWEKGRVLKAYLSVKTLNKIMASSGGSIHTVNAFGVGKLDLRLSSGSQFDGELKITDLTVDQSSGSEAKISGSTGSLSVSVSSGASFKAFDLSSEMCTANASSGGEIKITANKEINASASSGGSIQYKGSATTKDISKSSGGSVSKS